MRHFSPILVSTVLAAGCATVSVSHDYDVDADFSRYRTYAWAPEPKEGTLSPSASLLDKRIRQNVEQQLQAKALRQVAESPDLLVAYSISVEEKVSVSDTGTVYGPPPIGAYPHARYPGARYPGTRYPYYGPGGSWTRDVEVQRYREGTLLVDLVDAASKTLVWRGVAQGTVSESATPEQRVKRIADAVARMFEKYPPAP